MDEKVSQKKIKIESEKDEEREGVLSTAYSVSEYKSTKSYNHPLLFPTRTNKKSYK